MKNWSLAALIALMVILHQDWWAWSAARPLLFGVLPVGLWYHMLYALACAGVMAILVQSVWPKELENVQPEKRHKPAPSHPLKRRGGHHE